MISFDLDITYSQIALFNSDLENPFNDWDDAQVNQGFSWREQSLSFRTVDDDSVAHVEFDIVEQFVSDEKSIRTISLPFECGDAGEIEIASITDARVMALKPGNYQVVFETGLQPSHWIRLSAILDGNLAPEILVADADLAPVYPLVMGAHSA